MALETISDMTAWILPKPENPYKCAFMKYLFPLAACFVYLLVSTVSMGWDGFDADTANLIEIIPDRVPEIGSTIDVRNYDTDETETCLVDRVTRNRQTIEVVVRAPDGKRKTLVMEHR